MTSDSVNSSAVSEAFDSLSSFSRRSSFDSRFSRVSSRSCVVRNNSEWIAVSFVSQLLTVVRSFLSSSRILSAADLAFIVSLVTPGNACTFFGAWFSPLGNDEECFNVVAVLLLLIIHERACWFVLSSFGTYGHARQ